MISSKEEGLQMEIDDLRERLKRRNHLLDIVRKAYHRDVYAIRDCLLRIKNGESIESVLQSATDFTCVSSIDLRDMQGFYLFSPHECELKLKPCYNCGGRFEVVHRESSRITSLEEKLDCVQLRSIQLEQRVDEHAATIKILKDREVILNGHILETENKLHLERCRTTQLRFECVQNRSHAHKVVQLMENCNSLKFSLTECTSRLQMTLEHDNHLTEELAHTKKELERLKNDVILQSERFEQARQYCTQLEMTLNSERNEMSKLKETLSATENERLLLNHNLQEVQEELRASQLHGVTLTRSIDNLEKAKKLQSESFLQTERSLNETVHDLRLDLETRSAEAESLHLKMENDLKNYQEEMIAKLFCMQSTAQSHKNMTASFIRLVYDCCLSMGRILQENGRKSKPLHKDQQENAYFYICDCLDKGLNSERIDWTTLLGDDSNKNNLFGNMSNRLVQDINQLIDVVHTLQKKRLSDVEKIKRDSNLEMNRMLESFHQKLSSMEQSSQRKDEDLMLRILLFDMALADANSSRMERGLLKDELKSRRRTITIANRRINDGNCSMNILRKQIETESEKRKVLEVQVTELQSELEARQTSLDHLEKILGKTSTKLAQIMTRTKERLDTNVSVGVHVFPSMVDFGQQADFIMQRVVSTPNHIPPIFLYSDGLIDR